RTPLGCSESRSY
ncbi:ABC transporter family protein, partial [Vibrio parahaemolyticus EKP-028]